MTAAALARQVAEAYEALQTLYPGQEVDAQFAIPVPIDHVQDSNLLSTYVRVANTAQRLLNDAGRLRYSPDDIVPAASQAYGAAPGVEDPNGRIFTLPEAVAQTASYVTSLEAMPGVHGVVDIGAGTTDVSIFSLRRDEPPYWYSALVIPKAAAFVYRTMIVRHAHSLPRLSEFELIAETAKHTDDVAKALEVIRHDAKAAWMDAYGHLKQESAWHGCPVFLCGGGSLLPGARAVFRQSWVPRWPDHDLRELPTPMNYHGDGVSFSRMAVAYGLSIPKPEHGYGSGPDGMGGPVLPKDSPDHTPPKLYREPQGMGGDQLYPTPGWLG